MKVKYGENIYEFKGDLNCLLFSSLLEEGIEEVELSMFEEIFECILYDTFNFDDEKDYITLYQGLSYFGSIKEKELIKYIRKKIYDKEKKELQKEIVNFFEDNLEHVKWSALSENSSLPLKFFEKHRSELYWDCICSNSEIQLDFFKNTNYWSWMCLNTSIPLQFFKNNISKIYWPSLCSNPSIPVEFFKEHEQYISEKQYLMSNYSLPFEYLEYLRNKYNTSIDFAHPKIPIEYIEKYTRPYHWSEICANTGLPLDFFEKHISQIYWSKLSANPVITIDFVNKYSSLIDWFALSQNPSIPLSFLEENINKIHWGNICKNPNITIDFIKKHIHEHEKPKIDFFESTNYMNWYHICRNDFNIEKRVLEKIKNTKYFDFEPLEKSIKN